MVRDTSLLILAEGFDLAESNPESTGVCRKSADDRQGSKTAPNGTFQFVLKSQCDARARTRHYQRSCLRPDAQPRLPAAAGSSCGTPCGNGLDTDHMSVEAFPMEARRRALRAGLRESGCPEHRNEPWGRHRPVEASGADPGAHDEAHPTGDWPRAPRRSPPGRIQRIE
jgi:hypothetical protein